MPRIAPDLGVIHQVIGGLRMRLHTVITALTNSGNASVEGWESAPHPMRPISSWLNWYCDFHGPKAGVMMV